MENNYLTEHLKFIITRFDAYYENVNSKGAFYIALNSFFAGGIIAGYSSLSQQFVCTKPINFLLVSQLACAAISTIYVLYAINPFVTDGNNHSITYFGSIAKMNLPDFRSKIDTSKPEDIQHDLEEQSLELAKGLNGKFLKLQCAGILIVAQIIMLVPLLIFLMQNQKS